MKPVRFDPSHPILTLPPGDRWHAYQRLQDLGIDCLRLTDGSLQVNVSTATAAVQIWSVAYGLTASRQQMVSWLNRCWKS